MTEPALDLRASAATLRRGWIAILVIAIVGLCGGIVYGLLGRSQSSAVALVLVPQQYGNGAGAPINDMLTQTVIAMSTPVLGPATRSLSPAVSQGQVKVTVSSPANTNILRVQAKA